MPRIDEILENLNGSKWFSTFDLASGFWQIEMDQKDREKTAFVIKGGHYEFNVMPFGLCNAPATFQKTMNKVLKEYIDRFVAVFIDDIIVYSNSFEEHCGHLQMLFDKLETANLALNKEKCEMFKRELRFLGHKINKHGIQPDPQKIEKVQNFPIPKNVRQIKGFLGLASYYRKFIKDFSKIAKPLNNLTKKGVDYNWSKECENSFETLKEKLTQAPILGYPDFNRMFYLFTDASGIGLGAVLAQKDDQGKENVIAYASRTLNEHEQNYSAQELECLAIIWAVEYFHHFTSLKPFILVTDNAALKWLQTSTVKNRTKRARWLLNLQQYTFQVQHRSGKNNANADALSRIDHENDENSDEVIECFTLSIASEENFADTEREIQRNISSPEYDEDMRENNRWIQVHFSALNIPGCQTKWQWNGLYNNKKYRKNTYACDENDHHSHWYCTLCFQCANPHGNYISSPTNDTICYCNEEELYTEYLDIISDGNNTENEQQIEPNSGSEFSFSEDEIETIIDGKGKDWRQDMHNIFLSAAEFRQTTIKRMNGNRLEEFAQEYSVNCTLCGKIITTDLNHECIIGYNLGQVHPDMIPEMLTNEVFWDIPEEVQREDNACLAAIELLQPVKNPQNREWTEDELDEMFGPFAPIITPIYSSNFDDTRSRVSTPDY